MKNKLYCGAAMEKITPPGELLPKFFGLMRSSFSSIYDDLYVRVIALKANEKSMLLISVDLDKAPCPMEFTERLEQETGIPKENMLYFGIHAHAVPITGYRPFEIRNDITKKEKDVQEAVKAYEDMILSQLVKASRRAVDSLQPARYGYGFGKSYINKRRVYYYQNRKKNEPPFPGEGWNKENTDRTLFVMRFEDQGGIPIAFFINYPMHNVSMFLNDCGDGKMAVSSDIGGNVSKYMEREYQGAVAMWSSGAAGDINCIFTGVAQYPEPETGKCIEMELTKLEYTAGMMKYLAAFHFEDILSVNNEIREMHEKADIFLATEYSKTPSSDYAMKTTEYTIKDDETYNIRLRLARIGEVALIGVNGELYSSLGTAIKEASPLKNTVIVTHESSLLLDNPGYIFDDEAILAIQRSGSSGLPGWADFRGTPGTIAPSLSDCTKKLFENQ